MSAGASGTPMPPPAVDAHRAIVGVPVRHELAVAGASGPSQIRVTIELPDTWIERDDLADTIAGVEGFDVAEFRLPVLDWAARVADRFDEAFGPRLARLVYFAGVEAGGHAVTVGALGVAALHVAGPDPMSNWVRLAREQGAGAGPVLEGDVDRRVLRVGFEQTDGDVDCQRHGRVFYPALRTLVIVHLGTPFESGPDYELAWRRALESVALASVV